MVFKKIKILSEVNCDAKILVVKLNTAWEMAFAAHFCNLLTVVKAFLAKHCHIVESGKGRLWFSIKAMPHRWLPVFKSRAKVLSNLTFDLYKGDCKAYQICNTIRATTNTFNHRVFQTNL